jgi:TetR/AcrR family tetracycline transcriptional repressor
VDSATITRAALESLDDVGLDGLSMREVAARLGVRAGGLYYYLPDKAALLRSMANEICHEVVTDVDARPAGGGWAERAAVICAALRTVLRSHRDSARVLAAAPLIGSLGALALMERLIAVLEEGMPLNDACGAADTLMAYVTGFVLQEQIAPVAVELPEPVDELRRRYPRVFHGAAADDERMFTAAVAAVIAGFASTA